MCALAGRLGPGRAAWRRVIQLPFELAAFPAAWFAALRLPVVSYALPALIAIGLAHHVHRPTRNPLLRWLRNWVRPRTLKVLTRIQPHNGGFLEATPLTSFVVMSLAGSGQAEHLVTRRGLEFLLKSQQRDGSWAIDTNLATWVTTLSVNALGDGSPAQPQVLAWLLRQQYRVQHPYTHAAPGGWAWTDLPGGVPDADDTAGALVALRRLAPTDAAARQAAWAGLRWLLDLQNHDGGLPTFCRGWGALPFDRSSTDISAHAIRAWLAWLREAPPSLGVRLRRSIGRALDYLAQSQRPEGCWVPLWFGNQAAPDEENPTYGTARVLEGLVAAAMAHRSPDAPARAGRPPSPHPPVPEAFPTAADVPAMIRRGAGWLVGTQRAEGGWGGGGGDPASVEETALATEALARVLRWGGLAEAEASRTGAAVARGAAWLAERVETGQWTQPSPIGFYFAKLWYFERLYPLIFTLGALRAVREAAGQPASPLQPTPASFHV